MLAFVGDWKLWLVQNLDLSKDALHFHIGLALMFGTSLATKRPLANWVPWLVTLMVTIAGEGVDYFVPRMTPWDEQALHDLVYTMLWPTLILGLAKGRALRLR